MPLPYPPGHIYSYWWQDPLLPDSIFKIWCGLAFYMLWKKVERIEKKNGETHKKGD